MGLFKKLREAKHEGQKLKLKDTIKEHVSTAYQSNSIDGIDTAAKKILEQSKKETRKRRWQKIGIGAGLIIAAVALSKICPVCSKFIIQNLGDILILILG